MAYKLQGKIDFQGLPIAVENRRGSKRYWTDESTGETGSTTMKHPYGYVRGTLGTDGDEVDVFVGPNKSSKKVFVVTQNKKPESGMAGTHPWVETDEQKVMLGFDSAKEAQEAYLDHYDDTRFFGRMIELTMDSFKERLTTHRGKLIKGKMAEGGFTSEEALQVAKLMDLDLKKEKIPLSEWTDGLNEELEHKDVTHEAAVLTGKITLAHLKEDPHYYSKLKKVEKGLNEGAQPAIMCKDNIPMLVLPESDIDKAFTPQDLKPGGEETNKARMVDTDPLDEDEEDTEKSILGGATMYLQLVQKSLNEEKMDLKKDEDEDDAEKGYKSKKQQRYMHAAASRGDVPKKVVDEFDEKTKDYSKLPEDATPDSEKSVDVNKALRAITVAGLTRRQRLDAAYQLGRAQGQKHRKPAAEPAQISHEALNIGTTRVRPQHEPPVVPVRRVETPPANLQPGAEMESCVVHGYVHKSDSPCPMCKAAGIGEAGPIWRR